MSLLLVFVLATLQTVKTILSSLAVPKAASWFWPIHEFAPLLLIIIPRFHLACDLRLAFRLSVTGASLKWVYKASTKLENEKVALSQLPSTLGILIFTIVPVLVISL